MIFPSPLPLTLTLVLLALYATATPVQNSGSTPTCPAGPLRTPPDCVHAYCRGDTLFGGDGLCKKLCSCPPSDSAPVPPMQAPPPPVPAPVPASGPSPTCPAGPLRTAPDCNNAYCDGTTLFGGDGLCKKLCSCPPSDAAPVPPMPAPPLAVATPVPAPHPSGTTLDCGNAALSDNPNLPGARNTPGSVQAWCEAPGVNAVCVDGKVVVKGTDTDNVCRPLCRCS